MCAKLQEAWAAKRVSTSMRPLRRRLSSESASTFLSFLHCSVCSPFFTYFVALLPLCLHCLSFSSSLFLLFVFLFTSPTILIFTPILLLLLLSLRAASSSLFVFVVWNKKNIYCIVDTGMNEIEMKMKMQKHEPKNLNIHTHRLVTPSDLPLSPSLLFATAMHRPCIHAKIELGLNTQ